MDMATKKIQEGIRINPVADLSSAPPGLCGREGGLMIKSLGSLLTARAILGSREEES
jgi:hypothetical protein